MTLDDVRRITFARYFHIVREMTVLALISKILASNEK